MLSMLEQFLNVLWNLGYFLGYFQAFDGKLWS